MSWDKIQTITGKDDEEFGFSSCIYGNYAIIGARAYSNYKGRVYWYQRGNHKKWEEVHHEDGENESDDFGMSVAIYGNYAIVGARGYPNGGDVGRVYWYERKNSGKWVKVHHEDGESSDDYYGFSLGIYGNYAIIGAFGHSNFKGKVCLYQKKNSGKWEKIHQEEGQNDYDRFGFSVGIYENTAIVGIPRIGGVPVPQPSNTEGFPGPKGEAYFYQRNNHGKWVNVQSVKTTSKWELENIPDHSDHFGQSVAIHKNYAIVGAPATLNFESGAAFWYERRNGKWKEVYKDSPNPNFFNHPDNPLITRTSGGELGTAGYYQPAHYDRFGSRVSIYGNHSFVTNGSRFTFDSSDEYHGVELERGRTHFYNKTNNRRPKHGFMTSRYEASDIHISTGYSHSVFHNYLFTDNSFFKRNNNYWI